MDEIKLHGVALQRASALVPVLKERAAQAEQLRQVPPDSIQDLLSSGLIRIANPDRFGGTGLEIDSAFAVSWELGRGCGSTAWCYAIWTAHNWWLGYFPERCQEEYFATGPDTLLAAGLNPWNGTAERVRGGFRVSGRWAYSSGCDAASWLMVACRTGTGSDDKLWLLLLRSECEIVDTWFTAGLRGSGSKDVVVRDVFIPEHRTLNPNRAGDSDRTGWELHRRASYGAPLKVLMEWALAAPVIGMAQGVLDEFTSQARNGVASGRSAVPLQLRLAQASAELDTARMLHRASIQEILDRASQRGRFSPLDRARYVRDASFAVNLCVQSVNRLYEAGGARSILESAPIQRLHRDVHAASHHAALNWDAAAEQFGRLALGPGEVNVPER
ncbi:acyl-CoA dehydrogenase family protein [Ralstonia pseudosolanacearum]